MKKNVFQQLENIDLFNYYMERLTNIALAQFEWHNLPETCDRLYMETVALFRGSVAMYVPKGTDFWLSTGYIPAPSNGKIAAQAERDYVDISYANNSSTYRRYFDSPGNFNVYGYPTNIRGYGFNGQQSTPEDDKWEIFYDNMTKLPLFPQLRKYALLMYEIHSTMRNNTRQQNTPYLVVAPRTKSNSFKEIFRSIFNFSPVLDLGQSFNEDELRVLDLKVDFKGGELMQLLNDTWKEALSMLGITSQSTKRERMLTGEIMLDRQADLISLNSRLLNRVEFCNKMNRKYGLDMSVNLSSNNVDYETIFGPYEMSTNQLESEGEGDGGVYGNAE